MWRVAQDISAGLQEICNPVGVDKRFNPNDNIKSLANKLTGQCGEMRNVYGLGPCAVITKICARHRLRKPLMHCYTRSTGRKQKLFTHFQMRGLCSLYNGVHGTRINEETDFFS